MNSKKNIKILAIVFSTLLLGALVPYLYSKYSDLKNMQYPTGKMTDLIPGFKPENVTSITIKKGETGIELAKKNGNWQVNGKRASQSEVDKFLAEVKGIKLREVVSKSEANQKDYGVAPDGGTLVTLSFDDETVAFYAGLSVNSGVAFYLRQEKANEVYIATGNPNVISLSSTDNWRDKTVVNVAEKDLNKIEISGNKEFSVYKTTSEGGKEKWVVNLWGIQTDVSQDKADKIAKMFSPLSAFGFAVTAEDKSAYDNSWDKYIIKLFSFQGSLLAEFTARKNTDEYRAKTSSEEDIYKVFQTNLDTLLNLDASQ